MKTMMKAVIAFALCAVAPLSLKADNDRLVVSFTEHFTSFDGTKGSLDGNVVLAGKYNDKGTRHEDFTVIGSNKDGSEVYLTVTGTITASQGTISLHASGTIHFVSKTIAFVEGPESITGGTGAYAKATGKGSFTASQDMAGDPYQIVGTFTTGSAPSGHFANISTRGFVESGERVEIGGFIVRTARDVSPVVVRALGPSLRKSGVAAPLPDPTLDLRNKDGVRVALNDNWKDDATQAKAISNSGLAPNDEHEAAIFAVLPSGEYTAIVADKNGTSGTALVEMYNLSD
jgi:phage gp45-like